MSTTEVQETVASAPTRSYRLDRWLMFVAATTLLLAYGNHCVVSLLDVHDANFDPYRVLGSFWASGWAANRHLNPYGFYPLTWRFHLLPHKTGPLLYDVNLSPPWMLPLFQFIALVPIRTCVVVWVWASMAMMLGGTALIALNVYPIQRRQILWLLLTNAALDTLWLGQDYPLMFLLACCIWYWLRNGNLAPAGVAIGALVAMKPNLGLWPVLLFIAGYRRAGVIAIASAAGLFSIGLLYSPSVFTEWMQAYGAVPHSILPADISLAGVCGRLGSRGAGVALDAILLAVLFYYTWKRRPDAVSLSGMAICAGILCAPLAWYHYLLLFAPFLVGLGKWRWPQTTAAVLLGIPTLFDRPLLGGNSRLVVFAVALPHLTGLCASLYFFAQKSFARVEA